MAVPFAICYLNGAYPPLADARISPLDRGFLFADSVYEVLAVLDGRPYRFREHFDRLERSLKEVCIANPHTHRQWLDIVTELVKRNDARNSYVYVQVTRGMEFGRNHAFPAAATPTVFALANPLPELTDEIRANGMKAITVEDFRWARCDIKSTMLLANVLMKQAAAETGANEAIIVSDGLVREGASTSVCVVKQGAVITPPDSRRILPGTTRDAALELAEKNFPTHLRDVSVDELYSADEVWITAATRDVLPITSIDGKRIGDGKPGPLWHRMMDLFAQDRHRLAATDALDS
jgi:D-alanine transaminase